MAVRIIDNWWHVDLRFNRKRYRKRSPDNSKNGAEAYEVLLRQKLALGESIDNLVQTPDLRRTFRQFGRVWFAEYVVPNLKPSQQRNVGYILNGVLTPYFGAMVLTEITPRVIERYKAAKRGEGLRNKTIKNHLSVLNRCLTSACEWGELKGTPPKIKWPKCDPTEMDFLSFDECEVLLSEAIGIDYEMILVRRPHGLTTRRTEGVAMGIH